MGCTDDMSETRNKGNNYIYVPYNYNLNYDRIPQNQQYLNINTNYINPHQQNNLYNNNFDQYQQNNLYNNLNQYQQINSNQNIPNKNEQNNKNNEINNKEIKNKNNYLNCQSTEANIIKQKDGCKKEKIESNKLNEVKNSKNEYKNLKDDDYEIERGKLLDIIESNKTNLKNIAASFPERNLINLEDMAFHMKEKTKTLSEVEKAYVLFYWFHLNIEYDVEGLFSGNCIYEPESVYKLGRGVCSGYSILYKYFGEKIGINVGTTNGYAKGYGWKKNTLYDSINHEWNYIMIEGIYYLLDVTWGSGSVEGNKYAKNLKEKDFLPSPRIFLFSHLPSKQKFQLVENPITLEEFCFSIEVPEELFSIGLYSSNIIRSDFTVKNRKKLIIYHKIMDKANWDINVNLKYLQDETPIKLDCKNYIINYKENKFEIDIIFKKKGKYELEIIIYNKTIKYYPTCLEDATEKYEFTQEEREKAFVENLKFILGLEYTNINKENPIVKNREIFIFKPMLKIKIINLKKIEELTNKKVEWIHNSLMINNDKIENKTEIIGIFNSKGNYEMNITFENNYVFKYNMTCEEDSNNKFEFKPEEIDRYIFNQTLENENFAYISHKTNSFNVKNKETFIFQGTHKYYKLYISLQSNDNNMAGYKADKYIRVKPREDETKYEIEIFFNKKGKYDLSFTFEDLDNNNTINLKYYLTCEQDSEQFNEFQIEEIQRLNFYNLFPFFKYLSQKSNTFIAMNREIFVFEATKKIEFHSLPFLKLINDKNYLESKEIKNCVNIRKLSDFKYEIEVALNKKGKYELNILFHYCGDYGDTSTSLKYFPIIEHDYNPEFIIPIEKIKLTLFNIYLKVLDLPDNYLSHKNHIFKSNNKEKFTFKLTNMELSDINLYNPTNQEINTYIWTKKEESFILPNTKVYDPTNQGIITCIYTRTEESSLNTYEIDMSFESEGRYNIVFCLESKYSYINLEYFPIVEKNIKSDLPLSQNDFGLIPLNHKNFNFDLKDTNTLCLHFKRDEKKKYKINVSRTSLTNDENPKILTTQIPNELFYTIGFKVKGKYKIKILCEDSGIFRQLIYEVTCEKDSENDFLKYKDFYESDVFQLIEPVFNFVKIGNKVKFKIASTLPDIYLENSDYFETMDKIGENVFESSVLVKKENISIAKKEGNTYTYLCEFNKERIKPTITHFIINI